jgi:alkylhydroperoxidase/carboxymuconolactone decarboxylase family protein YurZ
MTNPEKKLSEAREYWESYYGYRPDQYERLAKYNLDIMANWTKFRGSTWKIEGEGGHLPLKFKELLAVGIEVATCKLEVGHVERAIDEGATLEEMAEVLGICIMLAGMMTYETGGKDVLKRAEEYVKKQQDQGTKDRSSVV